MAKEQKAGTVPEAPALQQAQPAAVAPSDADITEDVLDRLDALAVELKAIREGSASMPELLAFARKASPLAEKLEKHSGLLDRLAAMLGETPGKKGISLWSLLKG